MAFVRANGGVIHYSDEGPKAARPIVFINSLGTDFRIWDEVVKPLAQDARIIRHDKRGHGLSEHHAGKASIADFATDLAALLDGLHVRQATIVGLSIGGMIAQELYRLRPDLVASLVLCDTGHRIGTLEMWATRIAAVEAGGLESIADGVMQRWFTKDYHLNCADALAGWRMMLTRTPQQGYLAACGAIRDADLTQGAKAIRARTLCVVGDQDGSTPVELVRELASLIPAARLEIIAGSGHIPCVEKPDVLRSLIEAHLKEVSP
ncbi:3-oxoadipate enol-lactonase [Methylocapsa sp. S129]|uniref:3-oxoadipate enol-lactonase n=1 Tax=Methylocapsa sp. S129 TaxID=1641869 RepID=UPI00131A909D|nr:3-oxoadipate enol-lactonase [Methylocapsa sp. S129]